MSKHAILKRRFYAYIALGMLLVLFPFIIKRVYLLHVVIYILLYIYLSESWNILTYAGKISIGHAGFFAIGAYTSTILFMRWNITPWIGMFVGAAIASLLGLAIGYLSIRLKGPFFVLSTLASGLIVMYVLLNWTDVTLGAFGISIPYLGFSPLYFQFRRKAFFYYIILAEALAVIFIGYKIKKSKFGLRLAAIAGDEDASESLGIDVNKEKVVTFCISSFLTAIAGTFYAQYLLYIDPYSVGSLPFSVEILTIAAIGGINTVEGPIVGSLILVPIGEYMRARLGGGYVGAHLVVYGVLIMLMTIFEPRGLIEIFRKAYKLVSPASSKSGGNIDA